MGGDSAVGHDFRVNRKDPPLVLMLRHFVYNPGVHTHSVPAADPLPGHMMDIARRFPFFGQPNPARSEKWLRMTKQTLIIIISWLEKFRQQQQLVRNLKSSAVHRQVVAGWVGLAGPPVINSWVVRADELWDVASGRWAQ